MLPQLIVWILICSFMAQAAYSICAPFLPVEFERKGLPSSYTGAVFSFYSVGQIVVALLVGKVVDRLGHKNLLPGGIGLMGISFICLGLIGEMESRVNILSVVIIVRFFQGAAASTLVTTYYTICMNDFPERKVEFIGLVSTTVGLGLVCGPILGSALYSVFGYRWTFYTYGDFKIMFAIAMRLLL